ncbi:MAG: TolC family protein [Pedobacter sp.]|uniref:TolC family protein n=1 Tax=Pedobacter sp. TaxID=1411316 RepID=UPI002806D7C0|nr:TolC family protein [Pedobacter sp.]MDQ8006206.1 TolC family protein [Pedobacter sp.]
MKIKLLFICCTFGLAQASIAQDTLKLSITEAEKLFVINNYQLLLAKYEIEQAKADVITAKLFDNPEITHENLLYNHETKRFLETSYATGQFNTQVSQLFKLAGKRNKSIQLANTAVKLEEFEYFDLMRTLRYQLRSTFFKLHTAQQSAKIYGSQGKALEQLLKASDKQLSLGNIANKDIIRIKSLLYSLQAEYHQINTEIDELSAELKLLTQVNSNTIIETVVIDEQQAKPSPLAYTLLLDSAKTNRIDLKSAQTAITYAQQNLKLQKANAIPDVQLSLVYDLKGSYPEKYTGIGISIPIPLFNRNQGEIKKAKIAIEAQQTVYNQVENTLSNEVFKALQNIQRIESLFAGRDQEFNQDYQKLIDEVTNNFAKRNISLLEFLDFYESYKESVLQFNQLQYERINAKEEINFVTGTSIFK